MQRRLTDPALSFCYTGLEKDKDVSEWRVRWRGIRSRMGRKERNARMDLVAGKRGSSRGAWLSICSQSWCYMNGAIEAGSRTLACVTTEVVSFLVMARSTDRV